MIVQTKFKSMYLVSNKPDIISDNINMGENLDQQQEPEPDPIQPEPIQPEPIQPGPSAYKCPHCFQEFQLNEHLQNHIKSVHKHSVLYQCNKCNYKTEHFDEYKNHLDSHYEPKEIIVEKPCENCGNEPDADSDIDEPMNDLSTTTETSKSSHPIYLPYPRHSHVK